MDRSGTKSHGEREDEEVERLVRPSPKVKPPRHDKRRERVETDPDHDLKSEDKDLSMNYKNIGGSIASRVVDRWAAKLPPKGGPANPKAAPVPPQPAGAGAKPPKPESQKVKVRSKATGWVGWVSKDKLKEDPAAYEVADEDAEAKPAHAPETQEKASPKQEEKVPAPHNAERDSAAQSKLLAIAKGDPSFAAFLKAFKSPQSEISQFAENNPGFKAKPFMQGKELPEGIETIGDLARVVQLPPAKKQQKSKGQSTDDSQKAELKTRLKEVKEELAEDPKSEGAKKERSAIRDALKSYEDYERLTKELAEAKAQLEAFESKGGPTEDEVKELAQKILKRKNKPKKAPPASADAPPQASAPAEEAKAKPEEEALSSEPKQELDQAAPQDQAPAAPDVEPQPAPPEEQPTAPVQKAPVGQPPPEKKKSKGKGKKDDSKPEEYKPQYVSGQPERSVSSSERVESDRLVMRSFPPQVASKILFANPPYHPDEIKTLVADYNTAKTLPLSRLPDLLDKVPSFYATDPSSVPVPKKLSGKEAQEMPPAELAQLVRKHQVQTVAMSLATRSLVSDNLEKNGASKDLAGNLSDFLLSGKDEAPAERSKRAAQQAEELFLTGLQQKGKPMSDSDVSRLLKQVANYDPALEKLVVGYCQSRDYLEARELFLNPKSDLAISERQSPAEIASRISKAADFLHKRSARYPEGSTTQDTYMIFRNRVMKHLATLTPEKQALVQERLDQKDNQYYDSQLRKYEKADKAYQKQVESAFKDFSQDFKAYSKRLRESGNLDEDPPLTVEDRLVQAQLEAPKPPVKPPNYDKLTKSPEDMGGESEGLWEQFQQRTASSRTIATRVASRYRNHAFSFYPATFAMDRTAVYWGVDPHSKDHEGFEPYKDWEQPQARDLRESDFSRVLKAAREWLSAPVLSTNIEGIVRDTQLRAALDLALRAENYGHAIHPAVYNKLLARLAGVSEDKTLLTVRSKTARNPMSNKKVELETAKADQFLARLDRIASIVQSNHKKWGMSLEAAKPLVNAIDKLADDLEAATYGEASLLNRQTDEIGQTKLAQVLERDSDEGYMDTFKNPQKPIQTEADEPYMKAYSSDDSSGVIHGKASNGKPLAK